MYYSENEIISTLNLYKYAINKKIELENRKINNSEEKDLFFYLYIVEKTELWLSYLDEYDIELITLRHLKSKTFSQIAYDFNYANHSSIIKKYEQIIKKLKEKINE